MCDDGDTVILAVPIPANLSYTGEMRWASKSVDRCLALIVDALNTAGVLTASSCCGHGRCDGNIILHDGRELVVRHAV
jgi:hypothetical protein